MKNIGVYAKATVPVVLGGLYALQAALSDNHVTQQEWVGIGLAALTTVGVWAVPNVPKILTHGVTYNPGPNVTQQFPPHVVEQVAEKAADKAIQKRDASGRFSK